MSDVTDSTETDVRERVLVTAERLFREIGYQKTTVADIARVLRMSPANVYRFLTAKLNQRRRRTTAHGGGGGGVAS